MLSNISNDRVVNESNDVSRDVVFSVIIPTYNRSEEIRNCLNSLVDQTYKNFEVLICDDGSTDNTRSVVDSFWDKLRIKYIWEENWGGPAKPRNTGILQSQGKWICFLDSDDFWYNNKLEVIMNYIINNPVIEFICHDLVMKNIINGKKRIMICGPIVPNLYCELLMRGNRFSNSAIVVKKLALEHNHISLSESKSMIGVEDYDLSLQLAKCNIKFACVNLVLGEYNINANNISSEEGHLINLEFLLKKHVFELQSFESNRLALWSQVFSRLNIIKAANSFVKKNYFESLNYFCMALLHSRKSVFIYFIDRSKLSIKRMFR